MRKVSEILQLGLDQVNAGQEVPEAGMCIIIARMRGRQEVTDDEQDAAENSIAKNRFITKLGKRAFLCDDLRSKHHLGTDGAFGAVDEHWVKWYEDLIAELQAKGE